MGSSRDRHEPALRQERRSLLRPPGRTEPVVHPAHDDGRDVDQRQALLDPVVERMVRLPKQRGRTEGGVVADHVRGESERLEPRIGREPEQVPDKAVRLRIDGRADQRQRADEIGPLQGEGRRDLTTHRVRHERGWLLEERTEPRAELGNRRRVGEDGPEELPRPKLAGERLEVPLPDAEPVYEYDHAATVAVGSAAWLS